jgi:signal transduction histidine kinase
MVTEAEILEQIETSEGTAKLNAMLHYSNFVRQSEWQKSLEYARQTKKLAKIMNEPDYVIEALICEAYAFYYHSDFEKTKHLADEIYTAGVEIQAHNLIGTSFDIKARIAIAESHPTEALENYLSALEHCLKDPKPINLITCYNNLGSCYQNSTNYKEALIYFQLALDEAEKINFVGKEIIQLNIGCIQYAEEDFPAARESFSKAAEYLDSHNMKSFLADAYLNIGLCCQLPADSAEQSEYFAKSLQIKEEMKDFNGMSRTMSIIGDNLLDHDEPEKAYTYFQKSLKIAETHNLEKENMMIFVSLEKYWLKQKNYLELSEIRKKLLELTTQMNQKYQDKRLSEMEAKYKTEIYKLQTRELNAKNNAMQEQIDKLKIVHDQLKQEVEDSVQRINEQGDLLTSQSRMALMGEMVSLIAHQWRQPLNVIGVLVQSFQDAWEFDEMNSEYIEKQVKTVMDQIFYMSETITDFRNFFKSDSITDFDLKEVLEKALGLLDYMLKQSEITRTIDLAENCHISGNPNEIIQVVMNIVNNARDAMLSDNIDSPMIKITLKKLKDTLEIIIFNKGKQIPESILAKLFEPYFSTKGRDGTGIGLYICKMIIEHKYNGTIDAVNREDGVEFIIRLKGN